MRAQGWAQTLLPSRTSVGRSVGTGGSWNSPKPKPNRAALPGPAHQPADAGAGPGHVQVHMRTSIRSPRDAPALQRLRSPAEGSLPLLASPCRRSRGISPPQGWRLSHAPKRRPPGAQDRGGCRGKMASRFILEGCGKKGQR